MAFEQFTPPVSGALFVAVAGYVAISLVGTGPMIGGRVIELGGWVGRCEKAIIQSVKSDVPRLQTPAPAIDCKSVLDIIIGGDIPGLCEIVDVVTDPTAKIIDEKNRRLAKAYDNRVAKAAASANSKCTCSVNVVLESRVPWAVYAGTLRLIKMSEIDNLESRLNAALSSPVCAAKFAGASK